MLIPARIGIDGRGATARASDGPSARRALTPAIPASGTIAAAIANVCARRDRDGSRRPDCWSVTRFPRRRSVFTAFLLLGKDGPPAQFVLRPRATAADRLGRPARRPRPAHARTHRPGIGLWPNDWPARSGSAY